jgi:hypothetical protein
MPAGQYPVTENPGGVLTGRSFASVRQHAKDITDRWIRSSRTFPQMRQCALQLAEIGKRHSSEAFFGCDDPLESVIFSALLELQKLHDGDETGVDP